MEESEPGPGLTEAEIEALNERLEEGQYLPDYLRDRLFPVQQEAELSYGGRTSRSRVLSETMAVPLQTVKRFGEPENGWTNKLIFGDNLQVLKELLEMKARGELANADGSHGVRLCYIDPPFATKREFQGSRGQVAYRDKVEGAEFVEFLRKRLILIYELLAENGSLYLHLDTRKVHYVKVVLDELFGEANFRSEIIWKRSSAHSDTKQGRAQHGRIHDTILFYTKADNWVWNPVHTAYDETYVAERFKHVDPDGRAYKDADLTAAKPGGDTSFGWRVKAPEDTKDWLHDADGEWESPKVGWKYKEVFPPKGRFWAYSRDNFLSFHVEDRLYYTSNGTPRLKQYADELEGIALQDIWTDLPPINSQAAERLGYPTQKPLAFLERILRTSSNPGDLVLDCFAGSGTTAVASEQFGRRWIAIDSGKFAIYTSQGRLLREAGQAGSEPTLSTTASFDVCAAGLYDNSLLEELQSEDYRKFALELFGCRPVAQDIGGIEMAGSRSGDPVHVFPYAETDADMGREYIGSLEGRLKGLHSGACYVIAPKSRCDPGLFEDVIEVGEITFFILRIPYSAIEALYQRRFEKLLQPTDAKAINDPIDAFGFDFVRIPEVKAAFKTTGSSLSGEIRTFYRGDLDPDDRASAAEAGRGDLAMVMLDRNWDGDVFRISDYWFGETLEQSGWRFSLPLAECGERLLVIYIDTHGNERREAIEVAALRKKTTPKKKSKPKSGARA